MKRLYQQVVLSSIYSLSAAQSQGEFNFVHTGELLTRSKIIFIVSK